MSNRISTFLVLGALLAAIVAWILVSGGRPTASELPPSRRPSPAPTTTSTARSPASNPAASRESLLQQIRTTDRAELVRGAYELRTRARADKDFMRALIAMLDDPSESATTKDAVLFVLGSLSDQEAQQALLAQLQRSSDPEWSAALLLALGSLKEDDISNLFDVPGDAHIVRTASGLSIIERTVLLDPRLRAEVERHLTDESDLVRRAAVKALVSTLDYDAATQGTLKDVRDSLLRVLEHEPTPDIQADAAEALADWVATLPDRAVVSALIQQALPPDRGDLRRRIQANLSIAKLSTDDLRQVLQCRSDPEWTLEITAAHAEGHPELLKPFLETAGGEHRERTARLLRHFTDNPEAGAVLRNALHDPDAAVRKEAADSLGYLPPDPESIRALDGLLNDSSEEVRHAAALAIQALRSK